MANWLITGVSGGLGAALATAVLARGETVCGTVRSEEARAAFEARAPGRAIGLLLDLTDSAAIGPAVAEAEARMGAIDVLVNNAGHGMVGAIEESGLDQVRALFEVNVFAGIATIQAALPAMRARRAGTIVTITSVSGLAPWSGTAIYGASKYAMQCIGLTLAQEVAPLGIRVVTIAPGGIRTDFGGRSLVEADTEIADYADGAHRAKAILRAGGHRGDPEKAASAILAALDDPAPPRVLLLGDDALHYAEDEIAALTADIERWRSLTLSIAGDAEPATTPRP
jgi:NAD(P)-dependent dehydrogenase (short-subunit alcohol dehydrogenase family)